MQPEILAEGRKLLDKYRIERPLSSGGSSDVYLAVDEDTDAQVAIKVLKPEMAGAQTANMLQREALLDIRHPNVVRYIQYYRAKRAGDFDFLVMEFVDGIPLMDFMRGGVGEDDLIEIALATCKGLQAAHTPDEIRKHPVFHLDISPDNIILRGKKPRGATLIDFGIAKANRRDGPTQHFSGVSVKYNYSPPEQFKGPQHTGTFSDIYALGVTLIAAARGKPIEMPADDYEMIAAKNDKVDVSAVPDRK